MPRLRRITAPGLPHLVTARAVAGQRLFFDDADHALYRDLLAGHAKRSQLEVWAWAALSDHVHLIVVPRTAAALAQAMGDTHKRYAAVLNAKARRAGHLFRARYASVALDEAHLLAAIRYVAMNPVRARLVNRAEDWPWSSVRAHAGVAPDGLTLQAPVLARIPNFVGLLLEPTDDPSFAALRAAERLGRPLGGAAFLEELEARLGRRVRPQRRGRKKRADTNDLNRDG